MTKISDKDKKDWEKFTSSNDKLPNKDLNFKEKKKLNYRSLDLHGYTLDDANKKVNDFFYKGKIYKYAYALLNNSKPELRASELFKKPKKIL